MVGVAPERLAEVLSHGHVARNAEYVHWDKLRRKSPPEGLTLNEWWLLLKLIRKSSWKSVPLLDRVGESFRYAVPDPIPELLHQIDKQAGGMVAMPEQITNADTRDRYYVSSLMDEAITSSQLEGATTTREVAREMIRAGRPPRDRSEQMILNNFLTMQRIGELKAERLTRDLVFEIHETVTHEALDNPTAAGRFRRPDEPVAVVAALGDDVFHEPPPAAQLEERMQAMCDFANDNIARGFLHPVIRSIILHFWLAYDHPFVDGNGRTARALFYWSMLHHHYWLFEFISISQILVKAPVQYGMSFLYTETDDNDLTYFILYQAEVIVRAIGTLYEYIQAKTAELRNLEARLRRMQALNHRQQALVSHALRHTRARYTIQSHRLSHRVSYQTARTDLLDLAERGMLNSSKRGKTWYFHPAQNLEDVLGTDAPQPAPSALPPDTQKL